MTSKTAKTTNTNFVPRILFFIYPGIKLLDLSGPLQVFCDATDQKTGGQAYETTIVSLQGGKVRSDTGVSIETSPVSTWLNKEFQTLIVIGGDGSRAAAKDRDVIDMIQKLATKADRIASVCTGAFILAACKMLHGHRAVTHWQSCQELASNFPGIRVETDPIYIKDGNVWTSAGVTAGIDLALAMVNEDLGKHATLSLARSLVAYLVRPGGQSQFSVALERQASDQADRFEKLHAFVLGNLDKDLRVEILAEHANMSPRNFARIYASETGKTPAKAIEAFRIEHAQQLLEQSDHPMVRIAELSGFGDDERMRRAFVKVLKISPSDYRQRFRLASG